MRLLFLLLLIACGLEAQENTKQVDLVSIADNIYQDLDSISPGAYAVAVQNGKKLLGRGYRLASVEHHVPVTDSTIFDLASLAKMFTGYAIATLETEGRR